MQGTEACGLQHTSSPRAKALERRANAAAALMHEPAGQATRAGARGQIGERLGDGTGVPVVSANAQVDFARGPAGPVAAVNEVLSRLLPSQSRAVALLHPTSCGHLLILHPLVFPQRNGTEGHAQFNEAWVQTNV